MQNSFRTGPHSVHIGTPLYDAAEDRSTQVAQFLEQVRGWPINLAPGAEKAAAVLELAAGLRLIADELDPA